MSALTRYSCEDFPFRINQSCLVPRNGEIGPNPHNEIQ